MRFLFYNNLHLQKIFFTNTMLMLNIIIIFRKIIFFFIKLLDDYKLNF